MAGTALTQEQQSLIVGAHPVARHTALAAVAQWRGRAVPLRGGRSGGSREAGPGFGPLHSVLFQGDIPMTRSWTRLGMASALITALFAANPATRAEDLKEIARRLKNIEDGMVEIQKAAELIVNQSLQVQKLNGRINRLEEKVAQFQTLLDALRKGTRPERVSLYPPEAVDDIVKRLEQIERFLNERVGPMARVARAAPEVGRIMLINRHSEEMLFIVNNESYRVAPGATAVLDNRPAGAFTYEVVSPTWGQRARKTNTLMANETYRIIVE
jgi:hypothetical protein